MPTEQAAISQRLGWLDSVDHSRRNSKAIKRFAESVKADGFQRAILLGMGGSSLAPEVLYQSFGKQAGHLELTVLDNTDPGHIAAIESSIDLENTLFIASSKSGTTNETLDFLEYFLDRAQHTQRSIGGQFVVITDAGTPLDAFATDHGFRKVFRNPQDVGGRFSALSFFGLVPAALIGIDIDRLLDNAETMVAASRSTSADNQAQQLGLAIAEHAQKGRDKLMLALSPTISGLGVWIEQLIAESTGKEGKGVVPITIAITDKPPLSRDDQLWIRVTTGHESILPALPEPKIEWLVDDPYQLGAEFFRWEFATAVAGALLGVNPFDEPNVTESKVITTDLLQDLEHAKVISSEKPRLKLGNLAIYTSIGSASDSLAEQPFQRLFSSAEGRDYIAVLAFLPDNTEVQQRLARLREDLEQTLNRAICLAYGPRYLHSIGQLHKGGPNTGVFLQLTYNAEKDMSIPHRSYSFQQLISAQAVGDYTVLQRRHRRVMRVNLEGELLAGLDELHRQINQDLKNSGPVSTQD